MNAADTPSMDAKFATFRALHDGHDCFVMPNAWDAGSAKVLSAMGFSAIATTSAGLAFGLGTRDSAGQLDRETILTNAAAVAAATALPVSADLEDGFGRSPEDCARAIELASEAGLVGGTIEDVTHEGATASILPFNAAVERVAAACEAASSLPFMLTARSENYLHGRPDLDDTIRRLQAFEAAGAHVLYAPGLPDLEAIRVVCASVSRPVNVVLGLQGLKDVTVDDLAAAGVRRISTGGSFARVAMGAFIDAARGVRATGRFDYVDGLISGDAIFALQNAPQGVSGRSK